MGKRKKAAPPPKKKAAKMAKIFDCLFCGHEACCECYIDKSIHCLKCGAEHTSAVNLLEEAVDVYANWIDANDEKAREDAAREVEVEEPKDGRRRSEELDSDDDDDEPRRVRPVLSDDDDFSDEDD